MTESADIPAAPLDDPEYCDICEEPVPCKCSEICSECLKFPCICEDGL